MTTGAVLYVLKFRDFTGRYGLASEVVGAELMSEVGLPVPEWTPVALTDEFLDRFPAMWYRTSQDGGRRPTAGLHFGSRLTLSRESRPAYEVIPGSWAPQVTNLDDFVGALMIDLWTNNCDRRQAVFLREDDSRLRAIFIDNDHMFGGYFGNERATFRRMAGAALPIYRQCWRDEAVLKWRERIAAVDDSCIDKILSRVPEEWADDTMLAHMKNTLQARRSWLSSLDGEIARLLSSGECPRLRSPIAAARSRLIENRPSLAPGTP